MIEAIKEARTVDEAIDLASAELGKAREQLEFEILELPHKGFFGFKFTPAKVRVFYEESISKAQAAFEYLKEVLDSMNIDAAIEVDEQPGVMTLRLVGEGLGVVIGRRGETLDALQYLVGLVANRVEGDYTRITIDSRNYREKREKTLEALAKKLALNAVKTGRSSTLEPMNPYERRIIHATVSKISGASSSSIGEEPNRRIVISSINPGTRPPVNPRYKGNNPRPRTNASVPNASGAPRVPRPPYAKDSKPVGGNAGAPAKPAPFVKKEGDAGAGKPVVQAPIKAQPKKEAESTPLYTKIELD